MDHLVNVNIHVEMHTYTIKEYASPAEQVYFSANCNTFQHDGQLL